MGQQGKNLILLAYCLYINEEETGQTAEIQSSLCQFDMETGVLTEKKQLQDPELSYSAYPWAVLSRYSDTGCSRTDTFVNLVSGETIAGLEGEVYGLMLGKDGNPIVLTDTGVYVLPTGSKTLKKRYMVKYPAETD